MKVKICGITNEADALVAAGLGADWLGLNLYPESPRFIPMRRAKRIVERLKLSSAFFVGIFYNEDPNIVLEAVEEIGLSWVQLHGAEPPSYLDILKSENPDLNIIKAIGISEGWIQHASEYSPEWFLVEASAGSEPGGRGKGYNYAIARHARTLGKPFFLAGGLNPENLKKAIGLAKPDGVDVASGVEKNPRRKDFELMVRFIGAARI